MAEGWSKIKKMMSRKNDKNICTYEQKEFGEVKSNINFF